MCRRRLYFAGPAPRSETAGASPVAVVIGIIGDVDIVSMVRVCAFPWIGNTKSCISLDSCIIDDGMSNVSVDQFHLSILSDFTFLIDDDRENISAHGLILRRKD
ncbi:hypothetical protein Q3G72_019723 [Acer saccharum]|nr:hypothetical protein Q3G72_019723 [Acer saccharum]